MHPSACCRWNEHDLQEASVWRKESNGAMFEPEYLDLTCPECHRREVYFDRDAGFYCILCGRQFGIEDIQLLVRTEILPFPGCSGSSQSQTLEGRIPHRRSVWTHLGHGLSRLFLGYKHFV